MQNHQLRKIADDLKAVAGERGFALFLFDDGAYCSNGDRADVLRMIREWLTKAHLLQRVSSTTRAEAEVPGNVLETREEVRERLKLEALCAKAGSLLFERHGKLALFFFTFGERGNLARKTNDETIRDQLRRWCETVSPS